MFEPVAFIPVEQIFDFFHEGTFSGCVVFNRVQEVLEAGEPVDKSQLAINGHDVQEKL